jgi:hypothetical protein
VTSRGLFLTLEVRNRSLDVRNGPLEVTFDTSGDEKRSPQRWKTTLGDEIRSSQRSVSDLQAPSSNIHFPKFWDGGSSNNFPRPFCLAFGEASERFSRSRCGCLKSCYRGFEKLSRGLEKLARGLEKPFPVFKADTGF